MGEHNPKNSKKKALLAALRETAGSLSAEDHPEWATPEKSVRLGEGAAGG